MTDEASRLTWNIEALNLLGLAMGFRVVEKSHIVCRECIWYTG